MDDLIVKLIEQMPSIGGVLIVFYLGQKLIQQIVKDWRDDMKEARRECHEAYARVTAAYDATLARGNVLAAQLHERIGEMTTGLRSMNDHLEQCAKLVERIHEDNMRMRRDNAA